jgi:hypothetical protein
MTQAAQSIRTRSTPSAFARAWLATIVLSAGCLAACSGDDGGSGPPPGPVAPYFPADFLSSYVEVRDCRLTTEHADNGAVRVQVYASPECAAQYLTAIYPLPQGAILVKELWGDAACSQLVGYVTMRKGAVGTAPTYGDWEWQEVTPGRQVLSTGVQTACLRCHAGVDCLNRDFTCTDP